MVSTLVIANPGQQFKPVITFHPFEIDAVPKKGEDIEVAITYKALYEGTEYTLRKTIKITKPDIYFVKLDGEIPSQYSIFNCGTATYQVTRYYPDGTSETKTYDFGFCVAELDKVVKLRAPSGVKLKAVMYVTEPISLVPEVTYEVEEGGYTWVDKKFNVCYVDLGEEVTIPIPKKIDPTGEDITKHGIFFIIELFAVDSEGNVIGYYLNDVWSFAKDAEDGKVTFKERVYEITIKIKTKRDYIDYIKYMLSDKAVIESIECTDSECYVTFRFCSGKAVPVWVIALIFIAIAGGFGTAIAYLSYRIEEEKTKRTELMYKYARSTQEQVINYTREIIKGAAQGVIPPEKVPELISKNNPVVNATVEISRKLDETEKERSELQNLLNFMKQMMYIAVMLLAVYLILSFVPRR